MPKLSFNSTGTRVNRRPQPTCPLEPAREFSMQRPTQGVSKSCTPPRGAPEIPPRGHARLDHPPLWRRPHGQTSAVDFSSRSTSVEAASQLAPLDQPGLVRRARTYPWWETTGTFFSPQTPSGLGDDRASTRLYSWDALRPPEATKTYMFRYIVAKNTFFSHFVFKECIRS